MGKLTPLQYKALDLLRTIEEREAKYDAVNDAARELNPDFPPFSATSMDDHIADGVMELLDGILGGEVASWYKYECPSGGTITVEGKRYDLSTIDGLTVYLESLAEK